MQHLNNAEDVPASATLNMPPTPIALKVLKVPLSLANEWRSKEPNSIIGVALPSERPIGTIERLIVPSQTKDCSVEFFKIHSPPASYLYTHLLQVSPAEDGEAPSNSVLQKYNPSFSIMGSLSEALTLTPEFNTTYRKGLKARQQAVTHPSHRTVMAPMERVSTQFSDPEAQQQRRHLFKFYQPDEQPFLEVTKQRPMVATHDRGSKMSTDQIKEFMFKLFEAKGDEGVMLKEFQTKIKVSQTVLRTALEEIGEYTIRGGQKARWFLKKEYTLGK